MIRRGHLAGDRVLSSVGKLLREAARSTDISGRYGGDEFVVILPQTALNNSDIVSHRVLSLAKSQEMNRPDGKPLQVSIGVACLEAHTFDSSHIPRPTPATYFSRWQEFSFAAPTRPCTRPNGGARIRSVITTPCNGIPSPLKHNRDGRRGARPRCE